MKSQESLGPNIKAVRLASGMTQEELAKAVGVTSVFIGHVEQGKRNPGPTTLGKISEALGMSKDALQGKGIRVGHEDKRMANPKYALFKAVEKLDKKGRQIIKDLAMWMAEKKG